MRHKLCLLALSVVFAGVVGAQDKPMPIKPVLLDNVPGSVLVFPKFDIRADTATQLRIVNNGDWDIDVKLNYVCPGVKHANDACSSLDTLVELTPYETKIIDVADQNPPCNQGFVVAFVISERHHRPIAYDRLTGSYQISEGRRQEAENAIAVQSFMDYGSDLIYNDGQVLRFGQEYAAMPSTLFTDFRSIASDEPCCEGTRLTLLTLDTLAGMQNPAAFAYVNFWSADEVPFSTSVEFVCWTELQLDEIDYNFLEENLGTKYGSMKILPYPNCPIAGTCPFPNPYFDATMLGATQEYAEGSLTGKLLWHDNKPKATAFKPHPY